MGRYSYGSLRDSGEALRASIEGRVRSEFIAPYHRSVMEIMSANPAVFMVQQHGRKYGKSAALDRLFEETMIDRLNDTVRMSAPKWSAAELQSMERSPSTYINHISRSPGFLGIDLAKPGKDESVFFVSQHGKLEEYPMSNKLTPRDPELYVSQIGETLERTVLVETTKKVRVEYCGTAKERERVTGLLKDTFNDLWLKADGQATIGDTFGNSTAGAHFTPGRKARFEVRGPFNSAELDALAQYASAFSLIEVEVK